MDIERQQQEEADGQRPTSSGAAHVHRVAASLTHFQTEASSDYCAGLPTPSVIALSISPFLM